MCVPQIILCYIQLHTLYDYVCVHNYKVHIEYPCISLSSKRRSPTWKKSLTGTYSDIARYQLHESSNLASEDVSTANVGVCSIDDPE